MPVDPQLEAFCAFFNKLDKSCTRKLHEFYTHDVVFQDPLHRIEGAEALEHYFAALYSNVTACRFSFHERQRNGREAFATWTMHLAHPRLAAGKEYAVEGAPTSPSRRTAAVESPAIATTSMPATCSMNGCHCWAAPFD